MKMLEKYDFSLESNIKESLFNKMNDEYARLHESKAVKEVVSFEQLSGRDFGVIPGAERTASVKPKEKDGGGRKL